MKTSSLLCPIDRSSVAFVEVIEAYLVEVEAVVIEVVVGMVARRGSLNHPFKIGKDVDFRQWVVVVIGLCIPHHLRRASDGFALYFF